MSTFTVSVEVGDVLGLSFERVEALVDTGASYARVPRPLLQRLGIVPQESRAFRIADESVVEYDVGQAPLRIDGLTLYSRVVFGDPDSQPLLGAVTLEDFGLGVDPIAQRLVPVTLLLM